MFKERGIISIIILFFLVPIFSFAQEQKPQGESSELSDELAIQIVEKEKEKALKTGEQGKVEVIDTRIRDFKAGKITKSELLNQGDPQSGTPYGGDMSQNQNMEGSRGMDGYSQGKAVGMSAGGKSLKELQKAKEAAIKSGDMEEAKRIHAEIESIRKANKMSQDTSSKQSSAQQERHQQGGPPSGSGSGGPTPEIIIKSLEKAKAEALQSGNRWAAEGIDTQIKDFKAGKLSIDELMKQKPQE